MDRTHLQAQLNAAEHHLHRARQAQDLLSTLELPARVRIGWHVRFGQAEQSRIILFTARDLDWAPNFYTRVFFDGLGMQDQFRRYITATAVLPGLMETARAGAGNFLRRLFNPEAIRLGEMALTDLTARVGDLDRQVPEITTLLESGAAVMSTQRGGVQLFPGVHPVGRGAALPRCPPRGATLHRRRPR